MKRVVFCGHGRAGKDTACEMWSEITGAKNAGTCSAYLVKFVAQRLGISEAEAYAHRHDNDETRMFWRRAGDEVRASDPAVIVRTMLQHGDVGGGLRGRVEIQAARAEGLADLFVWVDNSRVPPDPTMEFGPEECDIVIQNNGTLGEFRGRLWELARFACLQRKAGGNLKRIFISGPVTKGDFLNNINQATEAFMALAKAGFAPFCPHWSVYSKPAQRVVVTWPTPAQEKVICEATTLGNDVMTYEDWMRICLAWVGVADAVLRLSGESSGADREVGYATARGIPVFHSVADVVAAAKQQHITQAKAGCGTTSD